MVWVVLVWLASARVARGCAFGREWLRVALPGFGCAACADVDSGAGSVRSPGADPRTGLTTSERRASRSLVRLVRAGLIRIFTGQGEDYYTLA